jgi:NADPH2:quinone reductase
MRAARCDRFTWPPVVTVAEMPDPVPGPGEILVAIRAASVNFPDVLIAAGTYQLTPTLPFTPGSEFSGVVQAVGPDVTSAQAGQAVTGTSFTGAFAEQIVVPADAVKPKPVALDFVQAAAYGVTYRTAYHALVTIGEACAGDTVVVLGAAGGVGLASVDIAHRLGMRVIAAASSAQRLRLCLDEGADVAIDYSSEDVKARIKELTDAGADVVIDPVGGTHAEAALRATRWGGRFVTVGFASGEIPRIPLNLVLLKGVQIRGFEIRTLPLHRPDAMGPADAALARLLDAGMRPFVSAVHPLDDIAAAVDDVISRRAVGKVVVSVG